MPILGEIKSPKLPVKLWAPIAEVESAALTQLRNIAMLPHVFHHVAAMPDVHLGKGATVGSVVAMQGAVCPAAVGVDIGCGMMALRLKVEPGLILDKLPALRSAIEALVPVGHLGNADPGFGGVTDTVDKWSGWTRAKKLRKPPASLSKARNQLGSLGGGNHFIEICTDTTGQIWVMLHSGSRNIGKELAEAHIGVAKSILAQYKEQIADPELAYFVQNTTEFEDYLYDLLWAQDYALANREEMMRRVLAVIAKQIGVPKLDVEYQVNCHHNYVAEEIHFGEKVLVTRKGAVRAQKGDLGIIPGSMGAKSFIVEGLGNPDSFNSCSHGAGRKMSRNQAKKSFTVQDLIEQTAGVECRKDAAVVDEIPGAYKDIDQVMANQSDLVKVVATIKQVMCIKG